jgi:hypothetical protein
MTTEPRSTAMRAASVATTGLLAITMTLSGALYLLGPAQVVEGFRHLGYPDYLRPMLGVAKLLGVAAILALPRERRLREWAYAGFAFDFVGAFLSHLASGDGPKSALPLVTLALLAGSYVTSHERPAAAMATEAAS